MFSTLWDMFKAALVALTSTRAAVVTTRDAISMAPHTIINAASAPVSAPGAPTDGVDTEGRATLNLIWVHSDAGASSVIKLYVYDGESWIFHSEHTLSTLTGLLDAWDVEGAAHRIAVELVSISAGTVTIKVTPHNEVA